MIAWHICNNDCLLAMFALNFSLLITLRVYNLNELSLLPMNIQINFPLKPTYVMKGQNPNL